MTRDKAWQKLEDYIANQLRVIDPYARHTKASGGNCGENHDIKTNIGIAFECKCRATESITIKKDVWDNLNAEIPLHSKDIPVLALENKAGKRWAVLDLDTFLQMYIELCHFKGLYEIN